MLDGRAAAVSRAASSRSLAWEIVRSTRRSSRRYNRSRTSVADLFADLYSYALALGCALTVAVSFVIGLRIEIGDRGPAGRGVISPEWLVLPGPVLWTLLTYAALAGITTLARRLGPISVRGPEGNWWLPLPVDRRPMVLPAFLRRCVLTCAGAFAAFLPFSFLTSLGRTAPQHLLASATFGAVSVLAVALAALQQLEIINHRFTRSASAVVLLPCAVLPSLTWSPWPLILAALSAIVLISVIAPRAGHVRGAELIRGGAVAGHASASIFFMDTNEMFRVFRGNRHAVETGRAARFYARPARGPVGALFRADIVAFIRLHPSMAAPVFCLGACISVLLVDAGLPAPLQLAVITLAGCATASSVGTVPRRTALVPELDALLPVAPALVRANRTLMPALAMSLWMVCLSGILVMLGPVEPALVLMGALSGVAMGAGAVRSATRPAPDWSVPPVETPFGPVPQSQFSSLLRGLDVTILALGPLLLALYFGAVNPFLIILQAIISTGVVAVVVLRPFSTR
ncbi:DUF6297 family protein [Pseudarthrobacter sp. lyk4-40-TYG-27]|uniref:DUF6297 family protein n=1 Tax=Pseudarthrobacter sp. lyk4-40-TYG-27 TaxID=3040305 RepID=UPI0025567C6D|nr:DUF6297 family protein [Pseudarthrobacter sp. lyk4-40-TYG-27]